MNRTFDRKIDDLINLNEKLIFLVGAGISMDAPSSVPSAKELSRILLKKSVPIEDLDKILNNPNARYELIIEKIKTLIDPDLKFLNYLELVNQPNLNHIFLVQSAKQGAFLITTNFDYLLEFAALKYLNSQNNAEVLPIILKEDYIKYSKVETLRSSQKLPIIKIHGSKKNIITNKDTSSSLVTTLNVFGKDRSKDEIFSIETYKKPLINDIMKDGCLIVMGYSGNDDFDISPLLKDKLLLENLISCFLKFHKRR